MALIGYTITVVAKQDNPYNVLPETDISIRKNSDNTLVNIYADEAGLIPIAQLGAKTDSNGQFTFYADASLGILKAVWTNGGVIATEILDQGDHSKLANRNAVGAHDAIYAREFNTGIDLIAGIDSSGYEVNPSDMIGFTVKTKGRLTIGDGGGAEYIVTTSGTPDGGKILASSSTGVVYKLKCRTLDVMHYGAVSGGESADAINAAVQGLDDEYSTLDVKGRFLFNKPIVISTDFDAKAEINFAAKLTINPSVTVPMGEAVQFIGVRYPRLKINGIVEIVCNQKAVDGVTFDDVSNLEGGGIVVNGASRWGYRLKPSGNNNSMRFESLRSEVCGTEQNVTYTTGATTSPTSPSSQRTTITSSEPINDGTEYVLFNYGGDPSLTEVRKVMSISGNTITVWPSWAGSSGSMRGILGGGIDFSFHADNNVALIQNFTAQTCKGIGLKSSGVFGNTFGKIAMESANIAILIGDGITTFSRGNAIHSPYLEANRCDIVTVSERATLGIIDPIFEQSTGHSIQQLIRIANVNAGSSARDRTASPIFISGADYSYSETPFYSVVSATSLSISKSAKKTVLQLNTGAVTSDLTVTLTNAAVGAAPFVNFDSGSMEILLIKFTNRNVILTDSSGTTIEGSSTYTIPPNPSNRIVYLERWGGDWKVTVK